MATSFERTRTYESKEMAAVIQHRFRALITFDPSAPESLMQGYLAGTLQWTVTSYTLPRLR
jgi:hypothetical protein